jgi:hypothetical protein
MTSNYNAITKSHIWHDALFVANKRTFDTICHLYLATYHKLRNIKVRHSAIKTHRITLSSIKSYIRFMIDNNYNKFCIKILLTF